MACFRIAETQFKSLTDEGEFTIQIALPLYSLSEGVCANKCLLNSGNLSGIILTFGFLANLLRIKLRADEI